MSVEFSSPINPSDSDRLWPQLLKDRSTLKRRSVQKKAAVISGTAVFTVGLVLIFFGYIYIFFEDRLSELLVRLPAVKRFFDFLCDHLLARPGMKQYYSSAITLAALFLIPAAAALIFKAVTALIYHPRTSLPAPNGTDGEKAEQLFTFADGSFEMNMRLNDRGKTPKIVSIVATALMSGLSIYGFAAAIGTEIKISLPLIIVGLLLLVVCFFFAVYGLETLASLIFKLFYFRSTKNIFDFRSAAEEMYNRLCVKEQISESPETAPSDQSLSENGIFNGQSDFANENEPEHCPDCLPEKEPEGDCADETLLDNAPSAEGEPADSGDKTDGAGEGADGGETPADSAEKPDSAEQSDGPSIQGGFSVAENAESLPKADEKSETETENTINDTDESQTEQIPEEIRGDGQEERTEGKDEAYEQAEQKDGQTEQAAFPPQTPPHTGEKSKNAPLDKAELKKNSPSLWTPLYVAENERQCAEVVSFHNKSAITALKEQRFEAAQEGLKNAAKSLLKMAEYDPEKYEPQLYITLYAIAKVSAFGQNDREQAKASLAACKRIAEKCARPGRPTADRAERELEAISRITEDFEGDMPLDRLRERYGKSFPADLCGDN